jgi:Predicted integral membrane zinc-ribbon metal-binding protein
MTLSCAETSQQPLPPLRKLWYDKLADALLGDDEPVMNAASSRYALICQKCFTHNGLVKEEMWEDARTHTFLLPMLSDLDHENGVGRIRLSQVWPFQSFCSLTAERSSVSVPIAHSAADSGTAHNAWCLTTKRTASSKQRRRNPRVQG